MRHAALSAIPLLLALSSCQLPGHALLTVEEFSDAAFIEMHCQVDPMGFDRQLVVRAPAVGIPASGGYAKANLQGLSDDGQTSLYMVLNRRGSSWYWLQLPPSLTLPNDTTLEAIKLTTDVGNGGWVSETYMWMFTREQVEQLAVSGLLGELRGGERIAFPAAYFSGFLSRWDSEFEAAYGANSGAVSQAENTGAPLIGEKNDDSRIQLPAPAVVHDVQVEVTGVLRTGGIDGGIAGFRGVATNQSREALQFCTITFELLDPFGAKIGNALASTQHLASGVAWKFDAYNAGTIETTIDSVALADVQTDRSLLAGISSGGFDPAALQRLKPGETTLTEAVEILGAEPMAKNYGADGSTTAMWSRVLVKGTNVDSRQATVLFDHEQRMVRILNETRVGGP